MSTRAGSFSTRASAIFMHEVFAWTCLKTLKKPVRCFEFQELKSEYLNVQHGVAHRSMSLFFLFGSVNRWFREKEVRYFILPSFVRVYMLTGARSTEISVPTSFTGAHAADEVHSAALESVKGKRYRRRREFNRLLELMCTSLCSALLFESSVHTAAQINHNYSTCSKEMPASVKKAVCLFVCPSVCLFCLPFLPGAGRKGREWMTKCSES